MDRDGVEPVGPTLLVELLDSWLDDLGEDEAFPEIEDLPPGRVDI
jgi:hypothetical protein